MPRICSDIVIAILTITLTNKTKHHAYQGLNVLGYEGYWDNDKILDTTFSEFL